MAPLTNPSSGPQSILLLPSPPTDTSFLSFRAAYGPALNRVLAQEASHATVNRSCGLDIAVLCENIQGNGFQAPRRTTYHALQGILAGVYRLIVHICAERSIDLDQGDQIDPRVILVGGDPHDAREFESQEGAYTPQGPVVTLVNLAKSTKSWTTVYSAEGENGEDFLHKFTKFRRSLSSTSGVAQFQIVRVPGGTSMKTPASNIVGDPANANRHHHAVAVGGTFDHLHLGHRLLLTATALVLDSPTSKERVVRSLIVGITGDELLKNKKYAEVLESWDERQKAVYQFLSEIMIFNQRQKVSTQRLSGPGPNENAVHYTFEDGLTIQCVEISDPFGPTITDESISGLIISGETRSGGKAVNDRREEKGWAPLEVFEVDVLDVNSEQETDSSSDFQSKLSSSEIRKRLQAKSNSVL